MQGLNPIRFVGPSFTTNSLGTNDPKVGDVARIDDENYLFVYNAGNSNILEGDGVIVSAVSGYSVTVSSVTSVDLLVGVRKNGTGTLSTGYYGYVCTRGFSTVNMGANLSAAAGGLLVLAADGKFTNKTISTGYVSPAQVKVMDAIASGASGMCYITIW